MKEKRFRAIYEQYLPYVYKIARNSISRREDLEEVVSDVFISVWDLLNNIEPGKEKALIITITRRRVADWLRKHYKLSQRELVHIEEVGQIDQAESFQGQNHSLILKLKKLLTDLNQKERSLIQLKYERKLTNRQVAAELGISLNNLKVRHNRLIKKLQKTWETSQIT
ncbi:MAG: sigma-70 family RNA polymerase sigma factor [Candidatus Dojkabacteria bacterium]